MWYNFKSVVITQFQTSLLNPSFLFTDSSEGQALALRFCIKKIDVNTYETTGTRKLHPQNPSSLNTSAR